MTTIRTPIRHTGKFKITPEAISLFKQMGELPDCFCDVLKPNVRCTSCEQYKQLHGELCAVLKLPAHCWPAIAHPDEKCPWPHGTGGADWWPEAQALWRALDRLAFPNEEAPGLLQ
jgi:hypothetical protein